MEPREPPGSLVMRAQDHVFDPEALLEEVEVGAVPEREIEVSLRPASFSEFVGQARVLDNLGVALQAARAR